MKSTLRFISLNIIAGTAALASASGSTVYSNNPGGDNYTSSQNNNNFFQAISSSATPIGPNTELWSYEAIKNNAHEGINTNFARNGNGSNWMKTVDDGAGEKSDIVYRQYNSGAQAQSMGLLGDLNGWSADTYTVGANTNPTYGNASVILRLGLSDGLGHAGNLTFDTNWDSGNPSVTYDQWNNFNIAGNNLVLHASGGGGYLEGIFGTGNKTFAQWQALLGGWGVTEFNAGIGTTSLAFEGAVDNYSFSFGNGLSRTTNFEATPEPATMAALGLGAIGLIRRRRQSK